MNNRKSSYDNRRSSSNETPAIERRVTPILNNAMREALQVLTMQSLQHAPAEDRAPRSRTGLGPIPEAGTDGITHVNFGPSAVTELGQVLSFANTLRFYHPVLDLEIPTLQHFWVFLQEGAVDKNIFTLNSDKLRKRQRTNAVAKYLPNQYALLAQAYWFKISEHQLIGDVLVDVNAKFDYYLRDMYNPRRPVSAGHLVDILKTTRQALYDGYEPDFVPFMDLDVQLTFQGLDSSEYAQQTSEVLAHALLANVRALEKLQPPKTKAAPVAEQAAVGEDAQPSAKKRKRKPVVELTPEELQARDEQALIYDTQRETDYQQSLLEQNAQAPTAPVAPAAPDAPPAPDAPAAPVAPSAPTAPVAETEGTVVDFAGFKSSIANAVA